MSLNFPSNPSLNETYTFQGKVWIYNGSSWSTNPVGQGIAVITSATAPAVLLDGSEWFDTTSRTLKVYIQGVWYPAGGTSVQNSAPSNPTTGAIWYDTQYKILKTYNGSTWISTASSTDIAAFSFAF